MKLFGQQTPLFDVLEDAITGAVTQSTEVLKDVLKEDGSVNGVVTEVPDKPVEKKAETTTTPAEEKKLEALEDALDEFGLTKAQQIEARQFFAALANPEKAATVVDFLATRN